MDLEKVFVRNMKKYRKQAALSQEKLAEQCGASASYIRQIECGSRVPSFALISKMAAALGVPASLLFDNEDDEDAQRALIKIHCVERELIEGLIQKVHSAFSKL